MTTFASPSAGHFFRFVSLSQDHIYPSGGFSSNCVRGEGVQGVLTLFCSGAAQVCHDDRVVELKEQLEEEDGDRQEEKVEEKGEESKRCAHDYDHGCM